MTIIVSKSQAAILDCMKSNNITDQESAAMIADLSVWCDLSYSQTVYALCNLHNVGVLQKYRPPGRNSQVVYWLAITDIDYSVQYHHGEKREVDMPRTWQEFAAMEW